jgi:hypothetical protein
MLAATGPAFAQTPPFFNVRDFGATGDGTTIDTPAINNAIVAANAAGGGTVVFPSGNYASISIHLTNNVTLYFSNSAVLLAANSTGMDLPEANPWSSYQDFGHSHFHNSLIWGENLHDIGFAGPGTINGVGKIASADSVPDGQADKAITLKLCTNVVIAGITITRAGHFGILANGCDHFVMTNTTILNSTASNHRDAINLINSSHAYIANCDIEGSDDAMCLKADFALGMKFTNVDIQVENCVILSTQNNATQFGSETISDFYNVRFSNLTLLEAGKAGIGITSNDGSIIDGVTYDNITMTNCACPIHIKISNQNRPSSDPHPVGRIRNVSINNVTARHSVSINSGISPRTNTPSILGYGESGQTPIPVENIVLSNVDISVIGSNPSSDSNIVPAETQQWTPNSYGPGGIRPAYGWYVRHAKNISFINCRSRFDIHDGRPALIGDDVQGLRIEGYVFDQNTNAPNPSPYDMGFTNVTAYFLTNCATTNGGAPRMFPTNSTVTAIVSPPYFTPKSAAYSGGQSVAIASATPGVQVRYTVDNTTPTPTTGILYSGPVVVATNVGIRAVAYITGTTNSAVNTAIFDFINSTGTVAAPLFSPLAGTYASTQAVAISSATAGASIRYTTNGTTPSSTNGTLYSGPIAIGSTTTLSAIAYASNLLDSAINSGIYTITHAAAAPNFSPAAGTYTNLVSVTLSSATPDASIRYTTDGSTPTSGTGTLYTSPIAINSTTTVKAIAFASGAADSPVTSAAYTIVSLPPSFVFEAELIPFITNGAAAALQTDVNSSNGKWEALTATAAGPYIQYTLSNVLAGTYQLSLKYKGNTGRGIITHNVDGVPLNDTLDQFSSGQTYPELSLGTFTFTTNGNHTVRQTVIGENASATAAWASADRFTLTLIHPPAPVFSKIAVLSNGIVQMNGTGYPAVQFVVQANTNLSGSNWINVGTATADGNGALLFNDATATNWPVRFYRFLAP